MTDTLPKIYAGYDIARRRGEVQCVLPTGIAIFTPTEARELASLLSWAAVEAAGQEAAFETTPRETHDLDRSAP